MSQPAVILVVDDVRANRETILELLDSADYKFVEAADGPMALQLAAEQPPDVVLLDVMMPGMDGFEVCRRLRADVVLGEVPILIVTSLDDRTARLTGLEAGADDFITKPFSRTELRARVRTITRLNRYRRLHESQAALRESEKHFRALFALGPVAVYSCDQTGQIQDFNQRAEVLWGRAPHLWKNSERYCGPFRLLDAEGAPAPAHLSDMARVCSGELPGIDDLELAVERPDGSRLTIMMSIVPLRSDEGQVTCAIASFYDITERKRLDAHFLQAQKMEALGQFSGGVAHDFNNILAVIGGYTELAQMVLTDNPLVREHLTSVIKATGRATDLVRQILTFSRQETQVRQAVQLHGVVSESFKLLRATIPSSIDLETLIAADTPLVLANTNQIHQVLTNLGINAWHAMKDRPGRIAVTLERFSVTAEYAATKPHLSPGDCVRISVSDTGCGMDPDTLSRIFEPFFTTKTAGQGTGLGLSVVHGIMDSHDGAVTVQSQVGQGTVFSLYFPIYQGEAPHEVAIEAPAVSGHGEAVLVVDDDEALAKLLQQTLEKLGYAALHTTDPSAALAWVQAEPDRFDLVLSDQTMPGMTGLVLASALKQIRSDLPIILMTGYSLSLTAEKVEEAQVDQLMLKPISIRALAAAVQSVLSGTPNPKET